MKKSHPIHSLHLRDATKKLLLHQKLGHTCDKQLYNTHKCIDVISKFSYTTSRVLHQCPTCIKTKTYKTPHDYGTTRFYTQLYQGLSIYFSSLGWLLMTVTKRLSTKESMAKTSGYWLQIISLELSMDMK